LYPKLLFNNQNQLIYNFYKLSTKTGGFLKGGSIENFVVSNCFIVVLITFGWNNIILKIK